MSTHLHQTPQLKTLNKVNVSVYLLLWKSSQVDYLGLFLWSERILSCIVLRQQLRSLFACTVCACDSESLSVICCCMHLWLLLSVWQLWHTILFLFYKTPAHHISRKTASYIVATLVAIQLPWNLWHIASVSGLNLYYHIPSKQCKQLLQHCGHRLGPIHSFTVIRELAGSLNLAQLKLLWNNDELHISCKHMCLSNDKFHICTLHPSNNMTKSTTMHRKLV